MLRKILFKKAKEASDSVDDAERILMEAHSKIINLRDRTDFSLLREELINNIHRACSLNFTLGIERAHGNYSETSKEKVDEALKNIEECFNEIEKLHKDK